MKKFYLLTSLVFVLSQMPAHAQVAINTDGSQPDGSAMLDIKSGAKGLLIPRMTTVQRSGIGTPADGLMVYDTDTKGLWVYQGGIGWMQSAYGSGGGLSVPDSVVFNSTSSLLSLTNTGNGNAGSFFVNNTSGSRAAVRGEVNSQYGGAGIAGIYGVTSGTAGSGGYFENTNPASLGTALWATTAGGGAAAYFETSSATNSTPTFRVANYGTGGGMQINAYNSATNSNVLSVTSTGLGDANDSLGNVASFFSNNPSGTASAVRGETNSMFTTFGSTGVRGVASGMNGYGGVFQCTNASGNGVALMATSVTPDYVASFINYNTGNNAGVLSLTQEGNGPGLLVNDIAAGGYGGIFECTNPAGGGIPLQATSVAPGPVGFFVNTYTGSNYSAVLAVLQAGSGPGLSVDCSGGSGDLALFSTSGALKARIDYNGKGYFDGGTQNSGADLAEAFAVEGSIGDYAPGDVLLISTTADRTVIRSNEAYSSLVAGVYATKPGVLLTEAVADSALSGRVPMGVVGVIPTKVCNEGGVIHRGDILVTSSRPGYAMKADPDKLKAGQAIGKALQEFTGDAGMIKVLVNVK
jgi:hypothetical protein